MDNIQQFTLMLSLILVLIGVWVGFIYGKDKGINLQENLQLAIRERDQLYWEKGSPDIGVEDNKLFIVILDTAKKIRNTNHKEMPTIVYRRNRYFVTTAGHNLIGPENIKYHIALENVNELFVNKPQYPFGVD